MKEPFKIGDRVRVYDSTNVFTAIFTSMHAKKGMLWVKDENGVMTDWYVQQCRRLKPKEKHPMEGKTFYARGLQHGWCLYETHEDTNYSFTISNIKKLKKEGK